MKKPAIKRVSDAINLPPNISGLADKLAVFTAPADLGTTRFNIWNSDDDGIILLLRDIFDKLGLLATFKISDESLFSFLRCMEILYNKNPFHNFRHCLCVTQMVSLVLSNVTDVCDYQ
jgi:hypothetical protein